jgi:hypothetical protein
VDRAEFSAIDSPWWLITPPPVSAELENVRLEINRLLGFSNESWFLDPTLLERLFDQIRDRSAQLLDELDRVSSETEQLEWSEKLVALFTPGRAEETEHEEAQARGPALTAPKEAQAPKSAPVRKSIFNKSTDSDQTAEPATAEETTHLATSVDSSGPASQDEPQKKSLFARRPAPASEPASASGPGAAAREPAVAREESGAEAETEEAPPIEVPAAISNEVGEVVSSLSDADLKDIAQGAGMAPEDLAAIVGNGDFEAMVAEELAKLAQ